MGTAAGSTWRPDVARCELDHDATVPALLRHGAERYGDADAAVTPDDRVSYAELDRRSANLAAHLVDVGVGKGTHVGLLLPNGTAWVVAWAAAARLGAVVVPVNTFSKTPEMATMLRHADVQVLVAVDALGPHDYLERLEQVAPELRDAAPGAPLRLPSLPQLRRVLLWGPCDRPWAEPDLARWTEVEPDPTLAAVVAAMGDDVVPADPLLITYTSGSTGEPKGVVHGNGPLLRHARNLSHLSLTDSTARIWTPMPLCWVGGFAFTLLRALSVGAAFVTAERFEPAETLRLLEAEGITHVSAWPALAKSLTEHPDYATTDLSAVRAGSFREALPHLRRPDPTLDVNSLGMSETGGPHTFWFFEEDTTGAPEAYRGTFGHEVPGTDHRIVDAEGRDVAEGEEGEVLVRGYSLMLGLHKRERAEVLDADGWYHTGDRGRFVDGWFFFTGRQSDLIKAKGSNVAPAEVERCLLADPRVKLAFVVGVDHPDRGQDVVALVVPWAADDKGQALPAPDPASLLAPLRDQLSSYKLPRHLFLLRDADVPYLTSQKPDRRALTATATALVAGATG